MTGIKMKTEGRKGSLRVFAVVSAAVCLLLITAYLLLFVAVRTPFATARVSRLLTGYLHQPVSVAGLAFTGTTLTVEGLDIGNPTGFREGRLVSAVEIAVRPDWAALLHGGKSLATLRVRGLKLTLAKNPQGLWNFTELMRRLSEKKGGGETYIRHLIIDDSALELHGFHFANVALDLYNLSTKGTDRARFLLTCTDSSGNPTSPPGGGPTRA